MSRKTVYTPHYSEGCHECVSKDHDGWLKGCQLSNDTNKPNGLAEWEPAEQGYSEGEAAAIGLLFVSIALLIEHHEDIAEWYNSNIKSRLTKAFRKDTARKSESLVDKELDEHNVIDIEEYRNNISIDNEKSVYSY